jgi:hypothetical protein
MSLVFLLLVASVIVDVVVVKLLPWLIKNTISTIQRFVFYIPLLAVGVMTHSYFLGPTYYRNAYIMFESFHTYYTQLP